MTAPKQPAQSLARMVTINAVADALSVSRNQIYNLVAQGRLPQPFKVSANCTRFREDEVIAAIENMRGAA